MLLSFVIVPSIQGPEGPELMRSQNWRAAVALLLSIAPTLPGLINNINPAINIGNASYLFNISWLFGVCEVSLFLTTHLIYSFIVFHSCWHLHHSVSSFSCPGNIHGQSDIRR